MAKKIFITENQFKNIVLECINEANSSIGGMRANSVNKFLPISKERSIMSEGIDWDVDSDVRGGTIVFSTDVNAVKLNDNEFINFLKQKIETIKNRLNVAKKVDKVANEHNLVGWTIGYNFDGRYRAKNGKNFGENSITVDIVGVSDDDMISIATDICKSFMQECVLLKLTNGKVYFINPN